MPTIVLPMSSYWLLAPVTLILLLWVNSSLDQGRNVEMHSINNLLIIGAAVLLLLLFAALLVAIQYHAL